MKASVLVFMTTVLFFISFDFSRAGGFDPQPLPG